MIPDKTIEELRTPLYPGLRRMLLPASTLLVLLGSLVSYSDWRLFRDSRDEVGRLNRLMQCNERFLSALSDAESGQRGYLLTGSHVYLQPYATNVKVIPGLLEALKREAKTTDQLERVRQLQVLSREKLSEMATSVMLGNVAGPAAAVAVVKQDKGRQKMDAIREISLTMRQVATAQLLRNLAEVDAHTRMSRVVIVVSGLVLVGLLIVAAHIIRLVEKRREELITKLDDKRNEIHTTLASIGEGLIAADVNGEVSFLNPVGAEITGWARSDSMGKKIGEVFRVIDENSHEELENPALKVLREREGTRSVNYSLLVRRDGTEVAIDDSAAPVFDSHKRLIGVVMVFRDITARRIAGRALRKWEQVFDTAGFGMAVLSDDEDPRFEQINPALAAMYGYSREELTGKPLSTLSGQECDAVQVGDAENGTTSSTRPSTGARMERRSLRFPT